MNAVLILGGIGVMAAVVLSIARRALAEERGRQRRRGRSRHRRSPAPEPVRAMRASGLPSLCTSSGRRRAARPLPARRGAGRGCAGGVAGARRRRRAIGTPRRGRTHRRGGLHRLRVVHRCLSRGRDRRRVEIPARGDPGTLHRLRTLHSGLPGGLHRAGGAIGGGHRATGARERRRLGVHRLRPVRARLSRGSETGSSPRRVRDR